MVALSLQGTEPLNRAQPEVEPTGLALAVPVGEDEATGFVTPETGDAEGDVTVTDPEGLALGLTTLGPEPGAVQAVPRVRAVAEAAKRA